MFESEGVSIRWYAKAKTITLNGRCQSETEEKLYSIASISKELAEVNKQNSDTDCALGNSFISLAEATSKTDRNDKSLEEHMQSFENRLQALSKEFAANMSTVNNILWEHSNELKQINNLHPDSELTALVALKRENLELKNQNKDLTDRISNLNYILADFQGKAKAAEDEKASLITSVRLLCNDLGINQPSNGNYPLQDNRPPENNTEAERYQFRNNILTQNSLSAQSTEEINCSKEKSLDHDRVAGPAVPTNNRFSHMRVEEANNVHAEINEINQNLNGHRQKENQSENKPNIAIVGDSMIKNINPRKLSRKRVNKFTFPGKRAKEIASEVKNINVQLHPTHVIIHAGTNNLPTDTGDQCIKNIKGLCSSIKEKFPKAKLGVSSIILRKDIEVSSKMYQVNEDLKRLCNESGFSFIDNSIIDESGLNNSNLHLSAKGSALLATRFITFLNPDKQLNKQPVGNHVSSENFLRDLLNLVALTQTSMSQRRRTR